MEQCAKTRRKPSWSIVEGLTFCHRKIYLRLYHYDAVFVARHLRQLSRDLSCSEHWQAFRQNRESAKAFRVVG